MHLVKWLRKNQSKIMAWVVILLMISFVGGYGLQQLLMRLGPGGAKRVIGHYDGGKLTPMDIQKATSDLELLKSLLAEQLLYSVPDLNNNLLGLLLFPNSQAANEVRNQLIEYSTRGQIQMEREQIDQYFSELNQSPELMWILLKEEARRAGVTVSTQSAQSQLMQFIPAISQAMLGQKLDSAQFLYSVSRRTGLTEGEIANVFADLLSIIKYSDYVLRNHLVTSNEVRSEILHNTERLSGTYYLMDAHLIADQQSEPSASEIQEQFYAFKNMFSGFADTLNPYGFGYKIPKQTAFEYILLNFNEVKKRIDPIEPEDLETYYSQNINRFQREVPADPNNPDGGTIKQQLTFAEVAGRIQQMLERERTQTLATRILSEAQQKTETGFDAIDFNNASLEQLQAAAGEYPAAAAELESKYQISMMVGKTSPLRPADITTDMILRGLRLDNADNKSITLLDIASQIPADGSAIRKPGMPTLRQWENIGPFNGGYYDSDRKEFVQIMGIVRLVSVLPAHVPDSVDLELKIEKIKPAAKAPEFFVLKDRIISDLKLKKAMQDCIDRAQWLTSKVESEDWDQALADYRSHFNILADPNKPIVDNQLAPRQRTLNNQIVPSHSMLKVLERQMAQPGMADFYLDRLKNNLRIRILDDLLPGDEEASGLIAKAAPLYYAGEVLIAKELTRNPATQQDFLEMKNKTALQTAYLAGMDLGLIHFDPTNIFERMHYEPSDSSQQTSGEEEPS